MIQALRASRIFIKPGATDMRKQINSLSCYVQYTMQYDIFSDSAFVFCNAKRDMIKVLYWDTTGFCLWTKRLEAAKFPWPGTAEEAIEISKERLLMLLRGIDFWHEHKPLKYGA